MTIFLVQNDTNPLDVQLDTDEDLTGVVVHFHMMQRYGDKTVAGACSVEDAEEKAVRYTPDPDDFDTPGVYDTEWELSGGSIVGTVTIPNLGTEIVQIRPQLAPSQNIEIGYATEDNVAVAVTLDQ